jgi:hypothetical protein
VALSETVDGRRRRGSTLSLRGLAACGGDGRARLSWETCGLGGDGSQGGEAALEAAATGGDARDGDNRRRHGIVEPQRSAPARFSASGASGCRSDFAKCEKRKREWLGLLYPTAFSPGWKHQLGLKGGL